METLAAIQAPWRERRRRAGELLERHNFAREPLTLYLALVEVQERIFDAALEDKPGDLVSYIAAKAVPRVVEVTVAAAPDALAQSVVSRFHAADLEDLVGRWLRSEEQALADRYLARAASSPVLEALGPAAASACAGPRDARHCPTCGGLPQLSYFALSEEPLVSGPRYVQCSRCSVSWQYPRMVCASCGEDRSSQLPIYADTDRFPHVRVAGCESCRHYLLEFDLRKDTAAVPLVDELASVPLDLYAKDRGLTKVIPNVMGF